MFPVFEPVILAKKKISSSSVGQEFALLSGKPDFISRGMRAAAVFNLKEHKCLVRERDTGVNYRMKRKTKGGDGERWRERPVKMTLFPQKLVEPAAL